MNARRATWALVFALAAACTPKDEKASSSSDAAAATATAVGSAMPSAGASAEVPATAENDPLPSHKDAAKTVRGEITKANYKAKLEQLEKEE